LPLLVTDYDTNIRAVAIIIDHRTTSISLKCIDTLIVSYYQQAVNHWL
jgi:hypothetical protein